MTLRSKVGHAARIAALMATRPSEVKRIPMWLRERRRPTIESGLPWLPFDLIDRLEQAVTPTSRVFEYGGGGSTVWFSERAGQVVTVEHDAEWFGLLNQTCGSRPNVRLVHEPDPKSTAYSTAAAGEEWDVVIVDGRERVECVRQAMSTVVPGGILVLDDTDRERYRQAFDTLSGWPSETIRGLAPMKSVLGQSTIWTRPLVQADANAAGALGK